MEYEVLIFGKYFFYFLHLIIFYNLVIIFGVTVLLAEAQEVEFREQIEKKELEILELTRQLKTQDEEKQNEIIKLQIEVCFILS